MPATRLDWFEKTRLYKRLGLSCSACAVRVVFYGLFLFPLTSLVFSVSLPMHAIAASRQTISQSRERREQKLAEKQGSLIGPPSSRGAVLLKHCSIAIWRGYAAATHQLVIYFHHFAPPLQYDLATWLLATGPKATMGGIQSWLDSGHSSIA